MGRFMKSGLGIAFGHYYLNWGIYTFIWEIVTLILGKGNKPEYSDDGCSDGRAEYLLQILIITGLEYLRHLRVLNNFPV